MKKLKGLSILMSTLLVTWVGINPALFAMDPNSTEKEKVKSKQSVEYKREKMTEQVQDELLRILFFRPDLIKQIRNFLPNNIQW